MGCTNSDDVSIKRQEEISPAINRPNTLQDASAKSKSTHRSKFNLRTNKEPSPFELSSPLKNQNKVLQDKTKQVQNQKDNNLNRSNSNIN